MKVSKLQELVPLYINGAMSENDRRVFAQALKQNATLKQEYLEFYELDSVLSSIDSADKQKLDALFRSINAKTATPSAKPELKPAPSTTQPRPVPNLANTQEIKETVERDFQNYDDDYLPEKYSKDYFLYILSSPKVAWAIIGLQFILLSILAVFKVPHILPGNSDIVGETNMINVVFADNATQKDIREMLVDIKAQIANGPSDNGLYTIYIRSSQKQADIVIDNLKKSKLILLAEPAFVGKN